MIHLLQRVDESIEDKAVFAPLPPREQEEDRLRAQIAALLEREKRHARRDYLNYINDKGPRRAGAVDAACRARACRWMFRVARSAGLRRETAVVAIGYLDGFLCSSSPRARRARVARRDFMLVAMACLRAAIRACEPTRREIDASSVAGLSKGLLSARDIDECERDVLAHMSREAHAPTTIQFLRFTVKLLLASDEDSTARRVLNDSYRQIEASMADYACVILKPSTVAIASVLNSLERITEDALAPDKRIALIEKMSGALHINLGSPLIKAVRRRLIGRRPRRRGTAEIGEPAVPGTPPRATYRSAGKRESVEDSPVSIITVQEMFGSLLVGD